MSFFAGYGYVSILCKKNRGFNYLSSRMGMQFPATLPAQSTRSVGRGQASPEAEAYEVR